MARKRKSIPRTLFILFLAFVAIANLLYYITSYFTKPPHIKYPAFGIDIPQGYSLHGIDVSRHQNVINWRDVREMNVKNIKIGFAFIKATEGVDKVDTRFMRNWLHAGVENIPKGAYHFFIAGRSGKAQAENFLEIVKLKKGDLPPVLDIEETYGTSKVEMHKNIIEWLEKVEKKYKVKPIIYTNLHFYNTYLSGLLDGYPLWIANYLQPGRPRINRKWIFWQHSESGRVNGITTKVDFNVFAGDSSSFKNLLIK